MIENATGGSGDDVMRGNQATNTLRGGVGEDFLDGRDGLDFPEGGQGDDIYRLDDANLFFGTAIYDSVNESQGGGVDFVSVTNASVDGQTLDSYGLGANLENASVFGGSAFNLNGNGLDNRLWGSHGFNVLRGNHGADTLAGGGGIGDDVYLLNDINLDLGGIHYDSVIEMLGQGADTVQVRRAAAGNTSLSGYTLTNNIENGVVKGTAAFNLTGNALANMLTGNGAANKLDGGVGADTMAGGLGNDVYVVDNAGDVVIEIAGGGIDTLQKADNIWLGGQIEHLQLLGVGDFNGSGTAGDNALYGNTGDNVLVAFGGDDFLFGNDHEDIMSGGLGSDTLNGGNGGDTMAGGGDADMFYYESVLNSGTSLASRDRINDFAAGDKINLSSVDADAGLAGDQAFVLDTNGSFSAGEIRQTVEQGVHLLLEFNTDADAAAEMAIQLVVHPALLTAGDFIL